MEHKEWQNDILLTALNRLRVGRHATHDALTLHPLVGDEDGLCGFDLLEDALRAGTLAVEETSDSGSVPELRVTNAGQKTVLILEGEELIGLKQNRTVNPSVLVGAGSSVILPVSCVERGRWSRSSRLSHSTSSSHLALRRTKSASVYESLRMRRGHRSDQRAVWAEVGRKSHRHGYVSETSALQDARLSLEAELEGFRTLPASLPADTRGVVVSVGGGPVALELLPDARTFEKAVERLVSGYALEALEYTPDNGGLVTDDGAARDFVRRLAGAATEEHAAAFAG